MDKEDIKTELEKVVSNIEKLETEIDKNHWHRDNSRTHTDKLRELERLYRYRGDLWTVLKVFGELNGKREVREICFSEMNGGV